MGAIILFSKYHERAPSISRAASFASLSSVTPERPLESAAAITLGHRLAGIESRAFMVRAWLSRMPMASPNLEGPPKASMTEPNESMPESLHEVAIIVNTARSAFTATLGTMKADEALQKRQGRRLQEARKQAGYKSAMEAARENDWTYSTYAAHERGTRTIGRDDADKYTRRFQTLGAKITAQQVLFPDDKTDAIKSPHPIDEAYQRGWNDALRAIAEAAGRQLLQKPKVHQPPKRQRLTPDQIALLADMLALVRNSGRTG